MAFRTKRHTDKPTNKGTDYCSDYRHDGKPFVSRTLSHSVTVHTRDWRFVATHFAFPAGNEVWILPGRWVIPGFLTCNLLLFS